MRGRKPIPTSLKLLAGNPGKRPIKPEPVPKTGVPSCPIKLLPKEQDEQGLSRLARREWFRLIRELKLGLATNLDRAALHIYCEAYARMIHGSEMLMRFGTVIRTPNAFLVQSPYFAIVSRSTEQMGRILSEFGLTPGSRTRLSAVPSTEQEDAEDERFFGPRSRPGIPPLNQDDGPLRPPAA